MKPRVVVVYPCAEGYEVIAANLIDPGVVIATRKSLREANELCVRFALSQRIRPLQLDQS
jgi:hypothetical protein